jgi:hypothetical protein
MGIMAAYTPFLHRGMGKLLPLDLLGLVGMAVKADLVPLGQKEFGEITLMNGMTGAAASGRNRAVDKFADDDGAFVAEETEIGPCCAKLELIGGLVRIMASGAFPLLNGGMDELFRCEVFVAVGAELPHVGYRLEFMLTLGNVAESAVTSGNRTVDKLVLSHLCMAFTCHTRWFLLSSIIVHCNCIPRSTQDKKNGSCNCKCSQRGNAPLILTVHYQ